MPKGIPNHPKSMPWAPLGRIFEIVVDFGWAVFLAIFEDGKNGTEKSN
jgi:hypothetical protein